MSGCIMDYLTNPAACRLFLEVLSSKRITAKQLATACEDIPQTSLYRYLKRMTDCGILEVVETHPIRGTMEKVYGVAPDFSGKIESLIEGNNGQAYLTLFTQYMMGLLGEFREYASRAQINIAEDCSGFTLAPAYLSKSEWEQAAGEIGGILARLMRQEKTPDRRLHTIGLVLTPPKDIE